MQILPFPRFNQDDYRGAPTWFFTFLGTINTIISSLNILVQNNIDFNYNLAAERQTITVQHNVPIATTMQKLVTQPSILIPGYASGQVVTGANITGYNSNGSIEITVLFEGAPTGSYPVTLIFMS